MSSTEDEFGNECGCYDMVAEHGEYAGLCLVFNIITGLVKCLPTRTGSEKDVQQINRVFGERFGYKVEVLEEKTGEEMKQQLQQTAETFNSKWRCFVCFVLSHGLGEDYIADAAGNKVDARVLVDCLNGDNCKKMIGKPKLFFFQMCRGFDREEYERSQHAYDTSPTFVLSADKKKKKKVARDRDQLVCFATTKGLMAPMDPKEGSLFIQTLTKVLGEKGDQLVITKVLQEVTRRVDGKSYDGYKVCPEYKTTLAYDLTFPLRVKKKVDDTLRHLPAGVPRTRLSLAMGDVIGELRKSTKYE